jgi:hypothetical protein
MHSTPKSHHTKKPTKEYPTPLQARGLLLGTNIRVPEEGVLMVINDRFARTTKRRDRGFTRPPKRWLRLIRPRGQEHRPLL